MTTEPMARISRCKTPTALVDASSERNEFEQTSSARRPVRWAGVPRTGRISCSTTGTPASAACHAASEPARPPPMTWMGRMAASSQSAAAASSGFIRTRSRGFLHHRLPNDMLDVAPADADVAELAVGELAELANRVAVAAPSGELLGNGLKGGHNDLLFPTANQFAAAQHRPLRRHWLAAPTGGRNAAFA